MEGVREDEAPTMSEHDTETEDRPLRREEQDPRCWKADGWTAKIVKNLDDDGWAVEMIADGASEPSLVGPWTMGRDKKNPKPLDPNAFATLVKTVSEVLQRHAQQRRAMLHKSVRVEAEGGEWVRVDMDIVPDEDDPHAVLTAWSDAGDEVGRMRVEASYRFSSTAARKWALSGYQSP